MESQEFILNMNGCIDILNQLRDSYGNKTIDEILLLIRNNVKCEISISGSNLIKIDDLYKNGV